MESNALKGPWSGLLEGLRVGVLMFDEQTGDVHLNPTARKMLGFQEEELQKEAFSIPEFSHSPFSGLVHHLIDLSHAQIDYHEEKFTISEVPGQEKKVYSILVQPLLDGTKRTGMMCFMQDLTNQVQREEATDQFIASLSHELRAPLNNVKMVIDILSSKRAGGINKTQEEFLTIANKDVDLILHTIDELNQLIELGGGVRSIEFQWTSIKGPIKEAINLINEQALNKRISIDLKLPDNLSYLVIDPYRIERIFRNLLDNAVKFSGHDRQVLIDIKMISPDDIEANQSRINVSPEAMDCLLGGVPIILVSVKDQGIGIAPEVLEHIFDRSVTDVGKVKTSLGGLGLGLPIVRELVEDHGGSVWVESKLGEGSCFTVALPVHNIAAEFQLAIKNEIRRARQKKQGLLFTFVELAGDLGVEDGKEPSVLKERTGELRSAVLPLAPRGGRVLTFEDLGTIVIVSEAQDLISTENGLKKIQGRLKDMKVMISVASYPESGTEEEEILLNRRNIGD